MNLFQANVRFYLYHGFLIVLGGVEIRHLPEMV